MSLCLCKRFVLTNEQIGNNLPCDLCQEEEKDKRKHAQTLKERFEALQKGEK